MDRDFAKGLTRKSTYETMNSHVNLFESLSLPQSPDARNTQCVGQQNFGSWWIVAILDVLSPIRQ